MDLIEIQTPIADTVADALYAVDLNQESRLARQINVMLHDPLPWDVILLIGIYEFGQTTGVDFHAANLDKLASALTENRVVQRRIGPALTYIRQLNDGIDGNEELTPGVLESLIHLLWLVVFRITGEDRFELGMLSLVSTLDLKYREHLNASRAV